MRGLKMKKTALVISLMILFISPTIFAQSSSCDESYIKAMTAAEIAQKYTLLKNYISNCQGSKYENHAYAHLCLLPYKGKSKQETLNFGEKAIALGGLDDLTQCQLYVTISGLYGESGQNLEKAKNYALQAIQIAQKNKTDKSSQTPVKSWNQLIGYGYYAHAKALEKSKDLKGAVNSYANSFKILKDKQIAKDLQKVGKSLYDFKYYTDAEIAFQIACSTLKDFGSCTYYAKTLYRNGKKDEALKQFKAAYAKQKSGEIAYNIGIILAGKAEKNIALRPEAIDYLLQASFLSPKNSKKAMTLAERLYFNGNGKVNYNEKVKEMNAKTENLEKLTAQFNDKFQDKAEEDLSDQEKIEMKRLLSQIEEEEAAIKKLEAETKAILEEFQHLIDQTKTKLGIT